MKTRQLVVVLVGGLLVPSAVQSAPKEIEVTARLYNTAQLAPHVRDAALLVATRTLMEGGVSILWRNCDAAGSCDMLPEPGELVIRLVRSALAPSESAGAALVLGEAAIDTDAGAGVLATLYVDRVEWMSVVSESDTALLLGRAVAHELGHLLKATTAHSRAGLMRANWSEADLRRNLVTDWILTAEDAAAIRKRLQ